MFNFDNRYRTLPIHLFTEINPVPVKSPELLIVNEDLAEELGVGSSDFEQYLSGNKIPEGAEPIAQAYAGHQFGQLNILGDGRAILLGEHITPDDRRFDIQLKGSGRTPYSRGGDGRGSLYSMFREYLVSNAMEKLGVPTTRSLAVVATGENVYRDNGEKGGILTRVASSHIRVGTFVYVAMKSSTEQLKEFTDYVIDRHFPEIIQDENQYLSLISAVIDLQVNLIVNWMRVGFIHGVMNTDNMSICGETIDYGPCAFMDSYDPKTVFSSIDSNGRYSFENQREIGGWNLARFAESLISLVDSDEKRAIKQLNRTLEEYSVKFTKKYNEMMAAKIGLTNPTDEDVKLAEELLEIMKTNRLDYTITFRNLRDRDIIELNWWYEKWDRRSIDGKLMDSTNPAVIPRNHIVENAISQAGNDGNMVPLYEMIEAQKEPYSDSASQYFKNPPEVIDENYKTYCGT
jgi:uncharacterized protein YdiU (UPF0061 family)